MSQQAAATTDAQHYQVAVLGAGIAGSLLAAVLARSGVSTVIIDSSQHPRFAIGESMVPESATLLRLIAKAYDVPEAESCSHPTLLKERVGSSHGVKLNFGFVHNEAGRSPAPEHSVMAPIFPPEAHLYRQDTDAYAFHTAISYGADAMQNTRLEDIRVDQDEVELITQSGKRVLADFFVDASGPSSPLVRQRGLRTLDGVRTHSGTIFNHFVGVKAFEEALHPQSAHGMPVRFSQGTLHHIFDGGWLWVIPFDNHPSHTNRLCSVGLQFDPRRFDLGEGSPAQQFDRFLRRFPGIGRQFESARPVRKWVHLPRMQYGVSSTWGPRWCLAAHTAGFVDPLFSRGLPITFESILRLASILIAGSQTGFYDPKRLEALQQTTQGYLRVNDRLVACSYTAFRDFDLWNAWYRIWSSGVFFAGNRIRQLGDVLDNDGPEAMFRALEGRSAVGSLSRGLAPFDNLFESAASTLEAVAQGSLTVGNATDKVFALLTEAETFLPPFGYSNPERRYPFAPTTETVRLISEWGTRQAPDEVRKFCFQLRSAGALSDLGLDYHLP